MSEKLPNLNVENIDHEDKAQTIAEIIEDSAELSSEERKELVYDAIRQLGPEDEYVKQNKLAFEDFLTTAIDSEVVKRILNDPTARVEEIALGFRITSDAGSPEDRLPVSRYGISENVIKQFSTDSLEITHSDNEYRIVTKTVQPGSKYYFDDGDNKAIDINEVIMQPNVMTEASQVYKSAEMRVDKDGHLLTPNDVGYYNSEIKRKSGSNMGWGLHHLVVSYRSLQKTYYNEDGMVQKRVNNSLVNNEKTMSQSVLSAEQIEGMVNDRYNQWISMRHVATRVPFENDKMILETYQRDEKGDLQLVSTLKQGYHENREDIIRRMYFGNVILDNQESK